MNTIEYAHFIAQQRKAFWTNAKETYRKTAAILILLHLLNNSPALVMILMQSA